MSNSLLGGVQCSSGALHHHPAAQFCVQAPRMALSRFSGLCRLRQALCSSTASLGRMQLGDGLPSAPVRCMAVRASRLKDREDTSSADVTVEQKAKALDGVMKEVNARFGKGSLMKMGSQPDKVVDYISSGALTLDIALGGGFPKGRIVEVFGPESSGKTTLAMHAIAEVQRTGGTAALIDAEHAFDPVYSKRAGVDIDNLIMCQPDSGEMALEVVDQLVRSSAIDIIVVDSVAALVPRAEIEGEIGAVQVGAQARLMSHALRKVTANASKCNCTVLFLNQLRFKVGVIYGNPEITSGGNALKFYASVRLEVRRKATIKAGTGEDDIGIRVKAKIVKNKCAAPYKLAEFDILFGSGISNEGCTLDAAESVGIISRKGSWYSYGERRLAQGREKTLALVQEDRELLKEIEDKTRKALMSGSVDINDIIEDKDPEEFTDDSDDDDIVDIEDSTTAPTDSTREAVAA